MRSRKMTVTRPDQRDHCDLIFHLEGHYNSFISESHILPFYDVKKHKTEKASKGKLETSKLASYHFKY